MELPFDLAPEQGIYLAAALVVAAFIRGLSGFGFSAIIYTSDAYYSATFWYQYHA